MKRPHVYERSAPRAARDQGSNRSVRYNRSDESNAMTSTLATHIAQAQDLRAELAHDETTDRLIVDLIDAAMNVAPGRRDVDAGLQRAEQKLRRHLDLPVPL